MVRVVGWAGRVERMAWATGEVERAVMVCLVKGTMGEQTAGQRAVNWEEGALRAVAAASRSEAQAAAAVGEGLEAVSWGVEGAVEGATEGEGAMGTAEWAAVAAADWAGPRWQSAAR